MTFYPTPLYFVRSGYINIVTGRLGDAGIGGYDWSTMASSKRNDNVTVSSAYYLHFGTTGVAPSRGPNYRWFGYPLRWLNAVS